jgi:exosortase/archaeosortase family protein
VPRFVLYAGVALAIFYAVPAEILLRPLLAALATVVGGLSRALGLAAVAAGTQVAVPGAFGIEIAVECSGVPELLLFLSAVFAYPASARSRAAGAAVAVVGVVLGNVLRLAALLAVGVHAPRYFDAVHAYVQGAISYLAMSALWIAWLRLSAVRGVERAAVADRP